VLLHHLERLDTAHFRHVEVDQNDVGLEPDREVDTHPSRRRFADDAKRRVHLDQLRDALAEQRVIVDQQYGIDRLHVLFLIHGPA